MVKTVLLTLLLPVLALAEVPSITRPVTDPQHLLTAQQTEVVSKALVDLRAAKQVQMAVLLVDTTEGQPIEDYAQAAFRQWKGGVAGQNNGLLLVIARADRRSRMEVGYGLEASLTDGEATALLHAQGPYLREGRFEPALLAIIAGVDARCPPESSQVPAPRHRPGPRRSRPGSSWRCSSRRA
ncbi:TPM domain-containing protein [Corallococcus exiguus]|uniref:TPM domain-containing protein n=1 Tax=Corallococcus exiguus TaxID=83462 RepID=UPI00156044D3|nr:TPM domain-containing protein [Corallococcus exiguus]NRD54419.1 TPM domain-containing protein [Corallococcus exiguus]